MTAETKFEPSKVNVRFKIWGSGRRCRSSSSTSTSSASTGHTLRFCAVEGDLDLLDRCHRSTMDERVVSECAFRYN